MKIIYIFLFLVMNIKNIYLFAGVSELVDVSDLGSDD